MSNVLCASDSATTKLAERATNMVAATAAILRTSFMFSSDGFYLCWLNAFFGPLPATGAISRVCSCSTNDFK